MSKYYKYIGLTVKYRLPTILETTDLLCAVIGIYGDTLILKVIEQKILKGGTNPFGYMLHVDKNSKNIEFKWRLLENFV